LINRPIFPVLLYSRPGPQKKTLWIAEAGFYTGQMPFSSPKQQHRTPEVVITRYNADISA